MKHVPHLAFLILSVSGFGQPSKEGENPCTYESSWKLSSIEGTTDTAYLFYETYKLFICSNGYRGILNQQEQEAIISCCWTKNGNTIALYDEMRFVIKTWNDDKIVLSPVSDESIEFIFLK